MSETIEIPTTDSAVMPLYEAAPDGEARGAVIVVQEAFGVNDHIEDLTRRFGAAGYHAVAPHLFHRSGDPRLPYEPFEDVFPHMRALTKKGINGDIKATLDHLHGRGFANNQIAIVGFCMGGTVTFITAATHALGAAATFYGSGIVEGRFGAPALAELAPSLRTPWIGFYGDQDRGIPVSDVEQLRDAVAASGVETEIVRYPDAEHGFHCDARAAYHQPSATDAWARTLSWLERHLAGPAS